MDDLPGYAVNLHRLFSWHHRRPVRDAARVLGASEHSLSGWLTGKRQPGLDMVKRIGAVYCVSGIAALDEPPDVFGPSISDPERVREAEKMIAQAESGSPG